MHFNPYLLASLAALLPLAPIGVHSTDIGTGLYVAETASDGADQLESGNSGSSSSNSNSNSNKPSTTDGPPNPSQLTCSADTSNATVVPFAEDPGWASTMTTCLDALNTATWAEENECKPVAANGTALGPSFGFFMNGTKWDDPADCWTKCNACLAEGIKNERAVTTNCWYDAGKGSSCEMGFNYGK